MTIKKSIVFIGTILGIFLVIFITGLAFIPRFPMGPFKLYADMTVEQKSQSIPFAVLSTEALHPFVYTESAARSSQEILTTKSKFKHVNNCLVSSEQNKKQPDLRMVNWDAFYSSEDVSICMWRIFNSLGTREAAEKWVSFHGFAISKIEHPTVMHCFQPEGFGNHGVITSLLFGSQN